MSRDQEGLPVWWGFFARHRGKLIGTLAGLLFGLIVVRWGVIAGLVLAATTGVGYWIGRRADEEQSLLRYLQGLWRPRSRD